MNESPLRVLVLGDSRSFHLERYVEELIKQGCDVLLASLEEGSMTYHRLRRGKPRTRLSYLLAASEIRALITQTFKPQVVNAHYAVGYGTSAAIATRGLSVPVVLQLWGSDILVSPKVSFIRRMKAIIALKSADIVSADSRYMVKEARKLHRFPHGEIIPWGIEQMYFDLFDANRSFGKPLRIISPRAHEPVYNHEFALDALRPFLERGEIRWNLPNWGSEADAFKEAAGGLVGQSIFLYPRKKRDDLMRFFAEQDIYLSAAESDSSPASLIEAMGLGLVPVCADIPGIREWLAAETGFLFNLDDEAVLTGIMQQLLTQSVSYTSMLTHNHEIVGEKAIFEKNVAQMIALMREAIEHQDMPR